MSRDVDGAAPGAGGLQSRGGFKVDADGQRGGGEFDGAFPVAGWARGSGGAGEGGCNDGEGEAEHLCDLCQDVQKGKRGRGRY